MKRSHFAVVLVLGCLAGFITGFSVNPSTVHAQSSPPPSYGGFGIGPIAPTVANCPAPAVNQAIQCPVGSVATFAMYISYNGLAYQPMIAPPAPTGVTSFNGRTGVVTLTKGDVTGTGLSGTATFSGTSTVTLQ